MTHPDRPFASPLVRRRFGFPWWRTLLGAVGAVVGLLGVMAAAGAEPEDVTWTLLVLIGLMVSAGPLSLATALQAVRSWSRRRAVTRDTAAAVLLLQRAPDAPAEPFVRGPLDGSVLEFRVVQSSTPTIPVGLHLGLTVDLRRVAPSDTEPGQVLEAWHLVAGEPHFVVHRPGSTEWWIGARDGHREGWPHPPMLRVPDPWTAPLVGHGDSRWPLFQGWGFWVAALSVFLFGTAMLEDLPHTINPLLMAALCGVLSLWAFKPVRVRRALLQVNDQNHHGRLLLGVQRVVDDTSDDEGPPVTEVTCRVLASDLARHEVGSSIVLKTDKPSAPMHAEIQGTLEALATTPRAGELVVHRTGSPVWWRTRAM